MATNKLTYNGTTYEKEITANSASLNMRHALVGETLTIDDLTIPVITESEPVRLICSDQTETDWLLDADGNELFAASEDVTPEFVSNGAGMYYFDGVPVGKYYLNELHQIGQYEHQMIFYSTIKLLDNSKHFGGLYSGQTVAVVLADIMGEVPYTVDDDIAAVLVYGYLPYSSRRNNLQLLLMAVGGAIRNSADGTIRITSLTETVTGTFNQDRVFVGGSIVDKTPATAVQVTEHNFISTTEDETLYDNTTFDTETITFSAPHHNYAITNGTITASGVNFVTFTGVGYVTITGQTYAQSKRVITVGTTPTGSDSDVVRTISGNTLLSPQNAADVAEKLYNYLTVAQSIKASVVMGSERPGDVVNVVHPYTKSLVQACIKSMEISMGLTELRAKSEFLIGYTPTSVISGFEHFAELSGDGTWTVPAGVTKIRIILIGGGNGGDGGTPGENGSASNGGNGGDAGASGSGGLVLEVNLNVTPGETYDFSCGVGGLGGAEATPGEIGGATPFGTYTSATGRPYNYGYPEPKSGITFGTPGESGIDGGNGSSASGDGASVTYDEVTYTPGARGGSTTYAGVTAYGGCGGGAAAGSNGGVGGHGYISGTEETGYFPSGGDGGIGADAGAGENATLYGIGGGGGHGGGGGGQNMNHWASDEGPGGAGGPGGQGAPGYIVVYY